MCVYVIVLMNRLLVLPERPVIALSLMTAERNQLVQRRRLK